MIKHSQILFILILTTICQKSFAIYDYKFTELQDCKIYNIKKERASIFTNSELKQFKSSMCNTFSNYINNPESISEKTKILQAQTFKMATSVKTQEKPILETWNEDEFQSYISNVAKKAKEKHISSWVIDEFKKNVKFIPRAKTLASNQPERKKDFIEYISWIASYKFLQNLPKRVRDKNEKISNIFTEIENIFGVDREIMISLWLKETNLTSFIGNTNIPSALATMAFKNPNRQQFFETNLINFLQMVDLKQAKMSDIGSWDGGIGGVQFMPQTFLRYSIDYDQDGVVDLYKSEPDMMASLSNYLYNINWNFRDAIATEVTLPEIFDYCLVGFTKNRAKKVSEWIKLGIKLGDSKFGEKYLLNKDRKAWLVIPDRVHILPSGCVPSAFLVYENYGHILEWNKSQFAAITTAFYSEKVKEILGL